MTHSFVSPPFPFPPSPIPHPPLISTYPHASSLSCDCQCSRFFSPPSLPRPPATRFETDSPDRKPRSTDRRRWRTPKRRSTSGRARPARRRTTRRRLDRRRDEEAHRQRDVSSGGRKRPPKAHSSRCATSSRGSIRRRRSACSTSRTGTRDPIADDDLNFGNKTQPILGANDGASGVGCSSRWPTIQEDAAVGRRRSAVRRR